MLTFSIRWLKTSSKFPITSASWSRRLFVLLLFFSWKSHNDLLEIELMTSNRVESSCFMYKCCMSAVLWMMMMIVLCIINRRRRTRRWLCLCARGTKWSLMEFFVFFDLKCKNDEIYIFRSSEKKPIRLSRLLFIFSSIRTLMMMTIYDDGKWKAIFIRQFIFVLSAPVDSQKCQLKGNRQMMHTQKKTTHNNI